MVPSSPAPSRRPPAPRSLADDLRARSDEDLAELLARRPDLAVPPPPDLTTLATAAAGRLSVQRAVDGLDTPTLQVLEVLAVLPEPVSAAEVGRRWGAAAAAPLATLRTLGLLWGGPRGLRLVRAARDSLGAHPAGLGPPLAEALDRRSPQRLADLLEDLGLPATGDPEEAVRRVAAHLSDPATVRSLLDADPAAGGPPPGTRDLLERLTWGPPVGRVDDADRPVRAGTAQSAVEWLLAHGLLAVADAGHVVLPREIGIALRGGRVHRAAETMPPPLPVRGRPAKQVDGTAAGAAAEAVRLVEELGRLWGLTPAPVLRAGGLGVRELRRVATTLEVDETTAALVVELAHAAQLVADDGEAEPSWVPTDRYDDWLAGDTADRWGVLVGAWLDLPRAPGLVGSREGRDGPVVALGPDVERPQAAEVRTWVLGELVAAQGTGDDRSALPPGPEGTDALAARLDWTSPRRAGRLRTQLVHWTLREAAWLGVTGAGAPSSFGAAAVNGKDEEGEPVEAVEMLDALLPPPVDHVLLQADLTAVAPGPPVPELARELALAADVESRGGATVYRFNAGSVRRALDAGRSADDLLTALARHSTTPVPQPLEYLITDTAKRYGRLRVGAASAYLRADDEHLLEEVLADRRATSLRLRRLAPTVLAAQAPPGTVLDVLRGMGLAPAAESPQGDLLVRRPDEHRTTARPPARRRWPAPVPARNQLLDLVGSLRAADRDRAAARPTADADPDRAAPALVPMDPAGALALLRDAAAARRSVWVGYLEDPDRPVRRLLRPLSVDAGRIRAEDRDTGTVRTFSVHRVIGVAAATR